jgi:hypothetical protein
LPQQTGQVIASERQVDDDDAGAGEGKQRTQPGKASAVDADGVSPGNFFKLSGVIS